MREYEYHSFTNRSMQLAMHAHRSDALHVKIDGGIVVAAVHQQAAPPQHVP